MNDQARKAASFFELHRKGDPLVLVNIWDAGSAKVVAGAHARAIATGSAPVASSCGYEDGENIPLQRALANLERILACVDLPVSLDIEGGYGRLPSEVAHSVALAVQVGAVGVNFEDRIIGGEGLFSCDEQADRLRAIREKADQGGVHAFINARTDLFLQAPAEAHDAALVDAAIERAKAYQAAGANGFFVPGLIDRALIGKLCKEVELPVNVLASPVAAALEQLAELGVARISHGPYVYKAMMEGLAREAELLHALGRTS